MSQDSLNIQNDKPAIVRTNINKAFIALTTGHSGTTAPIETYPLMDWFDITDVNNIIWNKRDEADSTWIKIATLTSTGFNFVGISNGANGTNGKDGINGSIWYNGVEVPVNTIGVNGDYYLNTSTGDVYQKVNNIFSLIFNIKGSSGNSGSSVKQITLPSVSQGASAIIEVPIEAIVNVSETYATSTDVIPDCTALANIYGNPVLPFTFSGVNISSNPVQSPSEILRCLSNNLSSSPRTQVNTLANFNFTFNFANAFTFTGYEIGAYADTGYYGRFLNSWQLYTSNDLGATWNLTDTQTNQFNVAQQGVIKTYNVTPISNVNSVKIVATANINNDNSYTSLGRLQFLQTPSLVTNTVSVGSPNIVSEPDIIIKSVDSTHCSIFKNTAVNGGTSDIKVNYLG